MVRTAIESVLHVTPTFYSDDSVVGGGEKYCNNISKVLCVVPSSFGTKIRSTILGFGTREFFVDDLIVHRGNPVDIRSLNASGIKREIRKHDVVHVHQCLTAFGLFVASLARLEGKIVVGTDHGGGEHHLLNRFSHFAHVYDGFVAQSDFAISAFLDFDRPIRVAKGPADDTVPLMQRSRKSRFFGNEIVAVGRIEPHKGFERIIECLPTKATSLAIIGRPTNESYRQFLHEKAEGKRVQFFFDLSDDEVKEAQANSTVFIHPSLNRDFRGHLHYKPELLGIAPLEALLQGTQVIVSDAGALDELAAVDGCVAFRTPEQLAGLIRDYVARGQTSEARRGEIRMDCIEKYGLESFGRAYVSFLEDLRL